MGDNLIRVIASQSKAEHDASRRDSDKSGKSDDSSSKKSDKNETKTETPSESKAPEKSEPNKTAFNKIMESPRSPKTSYGKGRKDEKKENKAATEGAASEIMERTHMDTIAIPLSNAKFVKRPIPMSYRFPRTADTLVRKDPSVPRSPGEVPAETGIRSNLSSRPLGDEDEPNLLRMPVDVEDKTGDELLVVSPCSEPAKVTRAKVVIVKSAVPKRLEQQPDENYETPEKYVPKRPEKKTYRDQRKYKEAWSPPAHDVSTLSGTSSAPSESLSAARKAVLDAYRPRDEPGLDVLL